jgi:Flp pilus assembly protein TadD
MNMFRLAGTGGRRWARVAVACLCPALLSACAGSSQTAWELIQQQQEKQAMINHYEAEQQRKNTPDEPHLMLSTIRQSQQQGRYFASLAYIDAYIKKYGRNSDIDALQADALRMTGQTADSEAAYKALLKTGKAADGWHGLGLLAGAQGNFALAAHDLEKAARLAPVDANILNDLGYARMRAGDLAGARVPLGKAAELDPQSDKIVSNLALLLLANGQTAQAKQVMDRASLPEAVRRRIYVLAKEIPRHPVAQTASVQAASVQAASVQAASMQTATAQITAAQHSTVSDLAARAATSQARDTAAQAATGQATTAQATTAVLLPGGAIVRNLSALPVPPSAPHGKAVAAAASADPAAGTVTTAPESPVDTAVVTNGTAPVNGAAPAYASSPIVLPVMQPRLEQRFSNPYSSAQASN